MAYGVACPRCSGQKRISEVPYRRRTGASAGAQLVCAPTEALCVMTEP